MQPVEFGNTSIRQYPGEPAPSITVFTGSRDRADQIDARLELDGVKGSRVGVSRAGRGDYVTVPISYPDTPSMQKLAPILDAMDAQTADAAQAQAMTGTARRTVAVTLARQKKDRLNGVHPPRDPSEFVEDMMLMQAKFSASPVNAHVFKPGHEPLAADLSQTPVFREQALEGVNFHNRDTIREIQTTVAVLLREMGVEGVKFPSIDKPFLVEVPRKELQKLQDYGFPCEEGPAQRQAKGVRPR